jgi:hypothetical protein
MAALVAVAPNIFRGLTPKVAVVAVDILVAVPIVASAILAAAVAAPTTPARTRTMPPA